MQRLELASRLQQGTVLQDSLKQVKTKIQLMMTGTNIKINSPAMKRNKTAEEPKKQNDGARMRVALEEDDRVKIDRWMTEPIHKVRTMFAKHSICLFTMSSIYSFIRSPCHQFTMMVHAIHYHPLTMPSIHIVIHSPFH